MTDLISREALLDELAEEIEWDRAQMAPMTATSAFKIAIRRVRKAPAVDAVELVRCKDCQFFMEYRKRTEAADGDCRLRMIDDADHLLCLPVRYADFCSSGCLKNPKYK